MDNYGQSRNCGLNYLSFHRLLANRVTFKQKELNSLKELTGEFDIVINCTGLGARKLCNDRRLVSIRGQVLKVCYLIMLSILSLLINTILTFCLLFIYAGKGSVD